MRSDMHGMELEIQEDNVCQTKLEQYKAQDMLCTKGRPPRFDSACNVSICFFLFFAYIYDLSILVSSIIGLFGIIT